MKDNTIISIHDYFINSFQKILIWLPNTDFKLKLKAIFIKKNVIEQILYITQIIEVTNYYFN